MKCHIPRITRTNYNINVVSKIKDCSTSQAITQAVLVRLEWCKIITIQDGHYKLYDDKKCCIICPVSPSTTLIDL